MAKPLIFGVFRLSVDDRAIYKYTQNLEHVSQLLPANHTDSHFLKMVDAGKLHFKDYEHCFFDIKKVQRAGALKMIETQYCLTKVDELEPASQTTYPRSQEDDPQNPNATNDLKALNLASEYFWSRASREDRLTWPLTAEVENYLISQGLAARSAAASAAIIRPDWAPPGRKPK